MKWDATGIGYGSAPGRLRYSEHFGCALYRFREESSLTELVIYQRYDSKKEGRVRLVERGLP